MSRHRNKLIAILLSLLPVLAFQACGSSTEFSKVAGTKASLSGGNGDGYNGKPTIYTYRSISQPCAEIGANGRPLPNREIFIYQSKPGQLVRDACADIEPRDLAQAELSFDAGGDLVFEGLRFSEYQPAELDVLAASCPAGSQPISGATRRNLMDAPLDLTSVDWVDMDGVLTVLDGTLAGLPGYRITRQRENPQENWLRVAQYVELPASKQYAFSVFVRKGTSSEVRVDLFDQKIVPMQIGAVWNLEIGARTDDWVYGGLTDEAFMSRPYAGGQFVTIYFKTPAQFIGLDVGLSPNGSKAGDSLYATAAQLEDVSTFCSTGP